MLHTTIIIAYDMLFFMSEMCYVSIISKNRDTSDILQVYNLFLYIVIKLGKFEKTILSYNTCLK